MGRGESKVGGDSATLPTAQQKKLDSIANRTRNLKNEQYRVIDANGNTVLEKKGGKHAVSATVGEKRDAFWDNDDAVSIHNHPDGGTFSPEDLSDFGYGAKAMVIASPEATYTLVANKQVTQQKGKGWLAMQDAYVTATGHNAEFVGIEKLKDLRERALKVPRVAKLNKQTDNLAKQWVKAHKEGRDSDANDIMDRYNKLSEQLRNERDAEVRRLEVKPYDDFLRKNAKKYGFVYKVVKR